MSNNKSKYKRGQHLDIDGSYYTIADIEWHGQHPRLYVKLLLARPDAPDQIVRPLTPDSYGGSIRIMDDIGEQMTDDYQYQIGDLVMRHRCIYKVTSIEVLRPAKLGATTGQHDYQVIQVANMTPDRNPIANRVEGIDTRSFRPRLAAPDALAPSDGLRRNEHGIVQFDRKPDSQIRKPRVQR